MVEKNEKKKKRNALPRASIAMKPVCLNIGVARGTNQTILFAWNETAPRWQKKMVA